MFGIRKHNNLTLTQGSFDDPLHFEEIVTPLRSEIFKGRNAQITTSNLAQLAMSTLGVTERIEDVKVSVLLQSGVYYIFAFIFRKRKQKKLRKLPQQTSRTTKPIRQ